MCKICKLAFGEYCREFDCRCGSRLCREMREYEEDNEDDEDEDAY